MKDNTRILYESLKEVINIIENDLEGAETCIDEYANYTDNLYEFKETYYSLRKKQGYSKEDTLRVLELKEKERKNEAIEENVLNFENDQLDLIKKIAVMDAKKYTMQIEELEKKIGFAERHNQELKREREKLQNTIAIHEKVIEKLLGQGW